MKASGLMVKCLEEAGIQYIFGVPGEENADFMMSLEESSIRFILCRHEQGAAFMADLYGRLTGKAAGCLGTLGPGATNLVTGVADANMDRAPMLVLTGQGSSTRLHKESHQAMDVTGLFEPITKWAHTVIHPANIPEMIHKAVRLAETEKPGAVHIELPEDIAKMETNGVPFPFKKVRRPVTDEKIVSQAMEIILNAKRPVILAGNGAIRKRASTQLRAFVEKTGIGVVTTFMGKGCIPWTSDSYLFTVGLQAKDLPNCALDAADVVITLGYDLVEYHPRLWNASGNKQIIHCDFTPSEVDDHYRCDLELVGDLAHTLWMFNERVKDNPPDFRRPQHKTLREQMMADIEAHKDDADEELVRPQKILWDTRQVLGPEDILISDVGAHKMWIARYYHCVEPNTCIISNGFCSMGVALPGAIGAKLVYPDRNIVAMCGDGGFMMNVQEMETAARIGANIVVVVWVDNKYGLIEWKQNNHFGRHTDLNFTNPDFVKLAELFGWKGFQVNKASEYRPALEAACACGKPALVAVHNDGSENGKLTERLGKISCPI
ncbi:MAG: acetolactate synthase large subunit [Candidatus Hydrogenedentes bacterium]|nr:acetolactate synthase large subunit [Candidatus Hydrogenedentota bacterium]